MPVCPWVCPCVAVSSAGWLPGVATRLPVSRQTHAHGELISSWYLLHTNQYDIDMMFVANAYVSKRCYE